MLRENELYKKSLGQPRGFQLVQTKHNHITPLIPSFRLYTPTTMPAQKKILVVLTSADKMGASSCCGPARGCMDMRS